MPRGVHWQGKRPPKRLRRIQAERPFQWLGFALNGASRVRAGRVDRICGVNWFALHGLVAILTSISALGPAAVIMI